MIISIANIIGSTTNDDSVGRFKGLLDQYSGAAAAYSLRDLSVNSISVVRVRRDSDNAEQDFNATEVIDGTLETFVGVGNNGFVTTWYDQSGNGNDATQSTASSQPMIVDAGVLVEENGKPAVKFDAVDDIIGTNLTNENTAETISVIASRWDTGAIASYNKTALIDKLIFFKASGGSERFRYNGGTPLIESYQDRLQNSYVALANSTDVYYYKNNSLIGQTGETFITTTNREFNIGSRYSSNLQSDAYIQEVIYWFNNQQNNLSGIFNNQKNYYNDVLNYESRIALTPDASGGDTGQGFTITGIYIDEQESESYPSGQYVIWCANDGRDVEPPVGDITVNQASVVKLLIDVNAADNTVATKLDELLVYNDVNFGTGKSIQGITLNNDDDIAFVSGDMIYIYNKLGVFQNSISVTSGANGLAFDFNNNYYLVYNLSTSNIERYNASGTLIDTNSVFSGGDQLYYDNLNELTYLSYGANGSPGNFNIYDNTFTEISRTDNVVFDKILSAEGIYLVDNLIFYATDGYFHQTTPYNFNGIGIYRIT